MHVVTTNQENKKINEMSLNFSKKKYKLQKKYSQYSNSVNKTCIQSKY